MKTITSHFQKLLCLLAIMSTAVVTLTSCLDDDDEIGNAVSGHWFGDMDMYYNGERARGSEIEFNRGWSYDRGSGVQVDYYARHAVTSYFTWRVQNRILYLTFDDPSLDCAIVDYRLSYDYFSGYIADYYTLENLKKERRYELCFEAIRWNDLRRWGDVSEIVKNQVGNHILNEAGVGEYKFTVDFMQRYQATEGGFFKIPEDQVTLSEGVLEQNPGWGDGTTWTKGDLPYTYK